MCWVTNSPPPRRSSFSSGSSTSSQSSSTSDGGSTTTSGLSRRVSFNATVKVYDLEPMEKGVKGKVFYSRNDYRRFRSDRCLEILDQQLQTPQPGTTAWHRLWKKIFHTVSLKASAARYQRRSHTTSANVPVVDYPWLTPYHPHDAEEQLPQQQLLPAEPTCHAEPIIVAAATANTPEEAPPSPVKLTSTSTFRETRLVQELAFVI